MQIFINRFGGAFFTLIFFAAVIGVNGQFDSDDLAPSNGTPAEHMVMGNPSGAVTDVNMPFNYLIERNQYVQSYHRDRGIPNWVAWHLDSTWIGSTPRQDDYRPDTTLPAGWYQVLGTDYSGSGFDRGHHTPSGDRTSTVPDNSATFLMNNMMPQAPDNNQGPWEAFESFCRTVVGQGNEIYIFAGSVGQGGTGSNGLTMTTAGGNVVVPSYTWKVVMIMPVGANDLSRVTAVTRTIAIIMPNRQGIRFDAWQKYLASVDQVEALTGYDFFSNVPVATQAAIESGLDAASNTAPQTIAAGTYINLAIDGPNTTLGGNITVNGVLTLGGSTLSTGANKITLGQAATVSRLSGMVNGRFEKQFVNLASPNFVFPVGSGPFQYSPVSINLTALGMAGSSLTVSPNNTVHPNAPTPATALKRYWTLTESGDLSARLTFDYVNGDIPAAVTDESTFTLQRYTGVFGTIPATINGAANTAQTTNSISEFSDWTLFGQAPSSAGALVAGQVFAPDGVTAVSRATITLMASSGQVYTARTNSFGYFRIDDVRVGESYVLNVNSKAFTFAARLIDVSEDVSGLVITAEPAGGEFPAIGGK